MNPRTDEAIQALLSMGFNESQAFDALTENGGDLEQAVNFLLAGGAASMVGGGSGGGATSDDTSIVHSEVSQYTDPSIGRSACTSIALTLASRVLTEMHVNSMNNVQDIINSVFLSDAVMRGMQVCTELRAKNSSGVEHLSVEEVMTIDLPSQPFSSLKLMPNSPRQGLLSSSRDNPLGLQSVLSACQLDATGHSYVAIVITKPPETVLILLPPSAASAVQPKYVLLDSHPRPNNLAPHYPSGSYALFHSDMQSLVRSLEELFPAVNLGSDVNEMMAMMYNSFDVYPFECKVG
ncbi:hypothetical protein ACHAWO_012641 [Cyclotella atomus]|uniref:UBA domain-containing protein n=1 Tax=Cyclotella atomus TaxID=382360 RepID=A0ABD3N878_9STRA